MRFIVDTDPGIDDAMALRFAASSPELDIVAVTTCFGNADVGTTTRNALALCRRFGIRAPVHAGAAKPLAMQRRPSPVHVHGVDGLGDAGGIAASRADVPAGEGAAEAIVRMARTHPGEISILALAPLTNLAAALAIDPSIAGLIGQVVVMGGAFGRHGRSGNVTPVAEANVWNDPHAADIVFGASWPMTVVGLDVTLDCVLDAGIAERLAREFGGDARFLYEISRRYEAIYREQDGLAGSCLHDVAAVAYAVAPELFDIASGHIRATTEGVAIGQTVFRPEDRRSIAGPSDEAPVQRICVGVDAASVVSMYCGRIVDNTMQASVSGMRSWGM
ncbi:nucleoside hydrolase [Pseudoxanthomonas putridarboris]